MDKGVKIFELISRYWTDIENYDIIKYAFVNAYVEKFQKRYLGGK